MLKRHRWEIEQREPFAGELEGVITMIGYKNDRQRMDYERQKQRQEAEARRNR